MKSESFTNVDHNPMQTSSPAQALSSSRSTSFQERYVEANGLRFCVHQRGPENGPVILFIMGFACQQTSWPSTLLDRLAEQGYRVISLDNRDIGLSSKLKSTRRIDTRMAFLKHRLGRRFNATYTLHDMAQDTALLLDALQIKRAHIVGASMGGMIAQILAAHYPQRVSSLNLIMSSTNAANQTLPKLSVLKEFAAMTGVTNSTNNAIDGWLVMWKAIQSPKYPKADEELRRMILENYQRSYCPGGAIRQLQAILATGSIAHLLSQIEAPTIVIHGKHDPLLPIQHSKLIVNNIDRAVLYPIDGMGHDFPEPLLPYFCELIIDNARQIRALS